MWGGFQPNGSSAGESSGTDNRFSVPKSTAQRIVPSSFCLQGVNGMSWNGCSMLSSSCNVDHQISSNFSHAKTESRLGVMSNSHEIEYTASCASNFDVFGNPSCHVALPSQLETMNPHLSNNLFPGTVHSASQSTLFPLYARSSCMSVFNGDQLSVSQIKSDQVNEWFKIFAISLHHQLLFIYLFIFYDEFDLYFYDQMKSKINHNPLQSQVFDVSIALENSLEPIVCSSVEGCDYGEQNGHSLIRILRKELTNSDVSNVGRIVLPKKEAEANLPQLGEKAVMVLHMKDFIFPHTWSFKYRYWPNNKSRMYVLETTGDFVRTHGLRPGDFLVIYKNIETGNYLVLGEKELPIPRHVNEVLCNLNCQNDINGDCSKNGEDNRSSKRQRNEEKHASLDCETNLLITKSEEEAFLNLMDKFGGSSGSSSSVYFAGSP
ncbi:putative transcription factor B3-Domain family [Dioscorea sansibarensis]